MEQGDDGATGREHGNPCLWRGIDQQAIEAALNSLTETVPAFQCCLLVLAGNPLFDGLAEQPLETALWC